MRDVQQLKQNAPVISLAMLLAQDGWKQSSCGPTAMLPVNRHYLCCRLQIEGLPWTQLMDASLMAAYSEHGATAADIIAACKKVPMDGALQEVSPLAAAFMSLPLHLYPSQQDLSLKALMLTRCRCNGCRRDWLITMSHGCTGATRGWGTEPRCHGNPE